MPGANSPKKKEEITKEIVEILLKNKEELLMAQQGNFCCDKNAKPKLVFKSPIAFQLGQLLEEYENE